MNEPLPPPPPQEKEKRGEKFSWEALAEEAIQDAYAAGAFENLPGMGEPLAGLDEPHDENWWIKEKLKREQLSILPPSLEILRDVEKTLAAVMGLPSERSVRREIAALNERIREANYRSVWGPPSTQMPIDIEATVVRWRAQQAKRR